MPTCVTSLFLRIRREKDEVAALQTPGGIADLGLVDGPARQVDAESLKHVLRQAGTVERPGTFSAPFVRTSDETGGKIDGVGG